MELGRKCDLRGGGVAARVALWRRGEVTWRPIVEGTWCGDAREGHGGNEGEHGHEGGKGDLPVWPEGAEASWRREPAVARVGRRWQ